MTEAPRIALLTKDDSPITFFDNSVPEAMHYYDDALHTFLQGSQYTLSLKTAANHSDAQRIEEGGHLSFRYKGKDYYLTIVTVTRDEWEVEIEAYGLSLELTGEEVEAYKSDTPKSFVSYLQSFGWESGSVTIGVNEVSDKSITHEWTGTDTVLKRLFSLATVFDAELEFVTHLNQDYTLKDITLNIYRKHSDTVQGIGHDRRGTILRYGKEIEGISRKADITELYTALRPTGNDGLTIASLAREVKDANGNTEYLTQAGNVDLWAPAARDRFPSNVGTGNKYLLKTWSYSTDSVEVLYGQALAELKKLSKPKVSYDVSGFVDGEIGDTYTIEDDQFRPTLYLEARIVEQELSLTEPWNSKTTFDNFTEVSSELSSSILDDVQKLIEANKTYQLVISSTSGTTLPPEVESTTLEARVKDGGSDVTDGFTVKWYRDGLEDSTGTSITVTRESLQPSSVFRAVALDAAGEERASAEVTLAKVVDGETVTVESTTVEYQVSNSGTEYPTGEWSTTVLETHPGDFLWVRTTIKYSDGQESVTYSVSRNGEDGTPGTSGQDAITLKLTSSNGTVFKNASIATVLTATVYKGGDKVTGDALTDLGVIQWYKDDTVLSTVGETLTINAGDCGSRAVYSARLGTIARDDITLVAVVDVQGIFRYWQLASEKPAKPTSFPPSSPWVDAEPSFSAENQGSLWYIDCTHFSDDTWSAGEVQLSSDYEATKALYADALQQLADAETRIDKKMGETEESIRSEVSEKYYSKDDTDKMLGEVSTTVEQTKDSIEMRFSSIQVDVDNLANDTNEKFQQQNKYIRLVDGDINLGVEGNELGCNLAHDRMSFSQSGQEIAWFAAQSFHITDGEIVHGLIIGNFAFLPRANGSLDFKKVR